MSVVLTDEQNVSMFEEDVSEELFYLSFAPVLSYAQQVLPRAAASICS